MQHQKGKKMIINITPVAKPRMTRSDKWKQRPCVIRYRAFCDELRLQYKDTLPDAVELSFRLPMPASWSEKKKSEMKWRPHKQKPDLDNLCKSVFDALCKDDSHICFLIADKQWDYEGSIRIKNPNEMFK